MLKNKITINITNEFEERPVALFVQVASRYESAIYVDVDNKHINAKSIMGMMSLGLTCGEEVTVSAEGEDEEKAMEDIVKYLTVQEA